MDSFCPCKLKQLDDVWEDAWDNIATWAWPSIRQEILEAPCTCMKEEPKPACEQLAGTVCDHIVGLSALVRDARDHGRFLHLSGLKDEWEESYIFKFYFCPKKGCGYPIDWDEIEKKLNTTK